MCSPGERRSPWKPRFVSKRSSRHLRGRGRTFSTTTRDRSLPVPSLRTGSRLQTCASVGMAEEEHWTTFLGSIFVLTMGDTLAVGDIFDPQSGQLVAGEHRSSEKEPQVSNPF